VEAFLPDQVKIVLAVIIVAIMAWGALSGNRLTPQQKAQLRQSNERAAGVEFILLGVVVPLGYFGLNLIFFNEPTLAASLLVGGVSVVCIALGIAALVRNR
jgi:hypothetical protein